MSISTLLEMEDFSISNNFSTISFYHARWHPPDAGLIRGVIFYMILGYENYCTYVSLRIASLRRLRPSL